MLKGVKLFKYISLLNTLIMIFHYIRFFFNFFNFIFGVILLNDYFERRHPNQYNIYREFTMDLFVNTSYNCIYYFSKFQIFTFQIKNKLNSFVEASPTLSLYIEKIISFFNNKNIGNNIQYVKHGKAYNSRIENFDFIINSSVNKDVILNRLFYVNDEIDNIFQETDIKFMLVEFKIGENIYKIDLNSETFNYYLVDNKFTKQFFIFYIKNHLDKTHDINNNDKCSLKIIDHHVNKIEFDFTDKNESIILKKSGYNNNLF